MNPLPITTIAEAVVRHTLRDLKQMSEYMDAGGCIDREFLQRGVELEHSIDRLIDAGLVTRERVRSAVGDIYMEDLA